MSKRMPAYTTDTELFADLSDVSTDNVMAIICGDIHLSHAPPACIKLDTRGWYLLMRDYLRYLGTLANDCKCPILHAGDLFHNWNAPAELINFAIQNLPAGMFSIHGQHDTPYHSYKRLQMSAYYTLMETETIEELEPERLTHVHWRGNSFHAYGWGWDVPLPSEGGAKANKKELRACDLSVAVIHRFCWCQETGIPEAPHHPVDMHGLVKGLEDFDVIIFGDNHTPFTMTHPRPHDKAGLHHHRTIYNCGSFMRRDRSQINHTPSVGLLLRDGRVLRHPIPIPDSFDATGREPVPATGGGEVINAEYEKFMSTLEGGGNAYDITQVVEWVLRSKKATKAIRKAVLHAIQHGKVH